MKHDWLPIRFREQKHNENLHTFLDCFFTKDFGPFKKGEFVEELTFDVDDGELGEWGKHNQAGICIRACMTRLEAT